MNILTLIKISWRNVWRNKLRSIVVIVSVVFGILGGIIMIAMSYGLNEERMNNAVETYLSHIQIHNESFSEDYNIKHTIDEIYNLFPVLQEKRNQNQSLEILINNLKPPIFWKEKPILLKQLKMWKRENLVAIIQKLNKSRVFTMCPSII